jgi:hypothetical protein
VCVCSGSGDPHYYTPDGALIHFMGTCKYTLWKSTIPNDPCAFRVETKNERRSGWASRVAFTRMIDFYMGKTKISILRHGITLVSKYSNYLVNTFHPLGNKLDGFSSNQFHGFSGYAIPRIYESMEV